jgi:hypothetical protein
MALPVVIAVHCFRKLQATSIALLLLLAKSITKTIQPILCKTNWETLSQ